MQHLELGNGFVDCVFIVVVVRPRNLDHQSTGSWLLWLVEMQGYVSEVLSSRSAIKLHDLFVRTNKVVEGLD